MTWMRNLVGICLLPFALTLCLCGPIMAGTLDDFEQEATESAEVDTTETREETSSTGGLSSWMGLDVGARLLWTGAVESWHRVRPPGPGSMLEIEPRAPGELQIPMVGLELRYQDVDGDVTAFDGRVEAGYGPLGAAFRFTHYEEESPPDELDITQWHGLYRMSFTKYIEVDLGLGSIILRGDARHSGFSGTLPVRIWFGAPVALLFRPTWSEVGGQEINDYDVALLYTRPYFSVCAGYRWLEAGDSALNGVFVGVSAQL